MAFPQGSLIPTTNIWDVSQVYDLKGESDQMKELLVRLYQNLNLMANVVNSKETGFYFNQEVMTSAVYSSPSSNQQSALRSEFAKTILGGTLAPGPAAPVPHGLTINTQFKLVDIYGAASDSVNKLYYPFCFAQVDGTANLNAYISGANVLIDNGTGVTFDSYILVIKFLKV